jgi:hypothetical protein
MGSVNSGHGQPARSFLKHKASTPDRNPLDGIQEMLGDLATGHCADFFATVRLQYMLPILASDH